MPYFSLLVKDTRVRLNRDIVYRWEFLIDFFEQFPDEEEILWTYSSPKEMLEWKNLNDNLDQGVEVGELLPLSKVWKTINFMRPTEKSYLKYYWIDPLVPERDRLSLHREQGRRLREEAFDGSNSMEFVSLAQSDRLDESIHNNMYLYYDPLSLHNKSRSDIGECKERLLNIDFINIASSLMYEARKRLGHSKLPEHKKLIEQEKAYLIDLSRLGKDRSTNIAEQCNQLNKKERFEIPFDLISWEDAWLLTDNKWYYLGQLKTYNETAALCDHLEKVDEISFKTAHNLREENTSFAWLLGESVGKWNLLYLALAGRDIDNVPDKMDFSPRNYHRIGRSMFGCTTMALGMEVFIVSDKMKTYSSNITLLYDKLLPAMCQVAPNAEYLGIERFEMTRKNSRPLLKGELYTIDAWGLISMINYQCIVAVTGSLKAVIKPKDVKKVVSYLLNHIGGRACVLMCERLVSLAEMGQNVSMAFCAEVLDQAANRQNEGFIELPSY
jgi:hypothetical protein